MNDNFRPHLLATFFIAAIGLFAGEAIYTAIAEPQASLWMVPIHLGVGGPLALLGAWVGAHGVDGWRRQFSEPWPAARISAWLLTAGALLVAWTLGVAATAERFSISMATPSLAAAATALVGVLLLVVLAFCSGLAATWLERGLVWVAERPRLGWLAHPMTWFGAAALGVLLAIVAGFVVAADTFRILPWAYVVGPASAVAAGIAAYFLLRRIPEKLDRVNRGLVAALAVLAIFALFLPMSLEGARQSFVDRDNLASQWKGAIHPILDFDGDGNLFFFAGGDCAPFDPDRGPHATEIPNDGIDWNCSGSDLTVDLDEFHGGPIHVERPEGIADKPHVILVTTDALSHPHTTVGGYKRDVTPNLAAWAEGATVFETAFSNSTSTRLALPGLLASKMNSQMKLEDARRHPYPYADDEETLGTILNDAGYRTVHIPGDKYFERWGGYWNGYDEVLLEPYRSAADELHTSPELTDAAVDIITYHDDDRPLHLWIHYFDHHGPYEIPEGAKRFGDGQSNQDRFDSELHFADGNWRRLFETIEEVWEPHEYVVVFTSDHGEAFDDNHPRQHHDFSVYTRPLHVPLIIQAPWGRGQRIEGLTGHVDVLPTIANLVGIDPRPEWEDNWLGESLIPSLVTGERPAKSVIYSLFYIPEAIRSDQDFFQMYGVRTDEWYFYENRRRGERRLVRWREDPLDRDDFRHREPDKFEAYRYVGQKKLEWLKEREIGMTHLVEEK